MEYSLENVSGIGKAIAERLKAAGLDTVQKLASMNPDDLVNLKVKGIGAATAKKYIDNAKKMLEESSPKEVISEKSEQLNVVEIEQSKVEKKETEKVEIKQEIKEEIEKEETIVEEKEEENPEPFDQDVENLKVLLKQQAECNIGTAGHVDHGMIMLFRHFP